MRLLSQNFLATLKIRFLSLVKIPLLYYCRPRVLDINDNKVSILIPFNRRSKNHLGSMYFGALAIGADISGGYLALHHINKKKCNVKLIFKDFQAEFYKRAEGDVHFICEQGNEIKNLVEKVTQSKQRSEMVVNVKAYVPDKFKEEPVASFKLTLSLK